MQNTKLHIVAFDVPYPLNYGGAIDVYHRIKALKEAGAEIYLHCFVYAGRGPAEELNKYCKEVFYYPRLTGLKGISLTIPYMVYSRRSGALLKNLQRIDAPILFEGVHCSYYVSHPSLKNRIKAVRTHNVEQDYLKLIGDREPNPLKRIYYYTEARLLKRYEDSLQATNIFLPITTADEAFFKKRYPNAKYKLTPSFHSYNEMHSLTGSSNYCIYHGNLAHPENKEGALYLLNHVFTKTNTPIIIAGRDPGEEIIVACAKLPHCTLIANPSAEEMDRLIREAHINVLITFQACGLKTKLLLALFNGRHALVNQEMLYGNDLGELCSVAKVENLATEIERLMQIPFSEVHIQHRKDVLYGLYNNTQNAKDILTLMQE